MTKKIIPAVASTNALISAACSMEALKLFTKCYSTLKNDYCNFQQIEGVTTQDPG